MTPGSVGFRVLEWYGLHGRHPGHWRVHAALRNLLKPRFDEDVQVIRQGLIWVLDPSDFPQQNLFWLGESDRWELLHAGRMLRPGSVIFDVGANFGYYALMLAAGLRKECEVHAFEPTESTYQRLTRHIALNEMDCVHAHRVALSDRPGSASMHGRDGNSGAAFLEPGEGQVQVTTLDEFVARRGIERLDLMKIDVEGLEEKVLRGGERVLRELRPTILFELQPVTLARAGSSVERLATLLTSQGYRLLQADRDRLVPLVLKDDPGYLVNGFAVPAS